MPTLATGSKFHRDDGFSLVELLAVLAILSLMVGAVVLNLPQLRSETDRMTEAMAGQLTRFLSDGAVAGEMRALGLDAEALSLFRHDGTQWVRTADLSWPDEAQLRLDRDGQRMDLPDTSAPILLFEPYGAVPDFALTLSARKVHYTLSADDCGQIIRTVDR